LGEHCDGIIMLLQTSLGWAGSCLLLTEAEPKNSTTGCLLAFFAIDTRRLN
jgi:hypothetical protein